MEKIFISTLEIKKVRHLSNIKIPLSENQIKHLILTGKNGSGKTSIAEALAGYLDHVWNDEYFAERERWMNDAKSKRDRALQAQKDESEVAKFEKNFPIRKKSLIRAEMALP